MIENLAKNMSDADEYSAMMDMHARCVSILAHLWGVQKGEKAMGTATTGLQRGDPSWWPGDEEALAGEAQGGGGRYRQAQHHRGCESAGCAGEVCALL